MKLGIDASNIRAGGGLTHIVELLGRVDPSKYGFEECSLGVGFNLGSY